jgi:hypothetical protein
LYTALDWRFFYPNKDYEEHVLDQEMPKYGADLQKVEKSKNPGVVQEYTYRNKLPRPKG